MIRFPLHSSAISSEHRSQANALDASIGSQDSNLSHRRQNGFINAKNQGVHLYMHRQSRDQRPNSVPILEEDDIHNQSSEKKGIRNSVKGVKFS